MRLKIGDRVRLNVTSSDGVPEGTKGTVIQMAGEAKPEFVRVAVRNAGQDQVLEMDPDAFERIRPIRRHASHGETERTRALQGINWAGTNLPEELLECEGHIRELLDVGYSYLFIERYLYPMGYGLNVIRKAFKTLTGMEAEKAVNFAALQTPGTIPQFNLGWGCAKGSKDYIFIMPLTSCYGVFRQKGDLDRQLEDSFDLLAEAVEAAKKKVDKLQRWDPPIKDMMTDMDPTQLYRQPQLFMQADAFSQMLRTIASLDERKSMIDQAFSTGTISAGRREYLTKVLCDSPATLEQEAVRDELAKQEEGAWAQSPSDMLKRTPQQMLNEGRPGISIPLEAMAKIESDIRDMTSLLKDFNLNIIKVDWSSEQPSGVESPVPIDEPDIMNATGTISVLVKITDQSLKEFGNDAKIGLMVFTLIRNHVETPDTIKGEDNQKYGITDDGLSKYFIAERERAGLVK